MTKWWMSVEPLPLSNDVHLVAITNVKGLWLSGHYWAINPPAQVQRKKGWQIGHLFTQGLYKVNRDKWLMLNTHKLLYRLSISKEFKLI